jgi:hypothetical protein
MREGSVRATVRGPLVLALCAAMAISACTSGSTRRGNGETGSRSAAATVPASGTPDSALLPPAAPQPAGDPAHQAAALATQIAQGGRAAEAALRRAVLMSGFDLVDVGGRPAGRASAPVTGIALPIGQLQFVAGQNTFDHGLAASDLAASLAAVVGGQSDKDVAAVQQAVLDDLRSGAASAPAPVRFLTSLIAALGAHASPAVAIPRSGDVTFTGLQSWLIMLRIVSEFAAHAGTLRPSGSSSLLHIDALSGSAPCQPDDSAGKVEDAAATGIGFGVGYVWDTVREMLDQKKGEPNTAEWGASDIMAVINAGLALVHLIVESFALHGDLEMVEGEPLVRTKSTTQEGEDKTLKLHLEYRLPHGQYANCLRLFLNANGLDVTLPSDGPVRQASVSWSVANGGDVLDEPIVFHPTHLGTGAQGDAVLSTTDDSGDAVMTVQGRRQHDRVPDDASPYIRQVRVYAAVQIKASTLYSDLADGLGVLTAGFAAPALLLQTILERLHAWSVSRVFTVRDWAVDLRAWDLPERKDLFYKCGGPEGTWHWLNEGDEGMSVPELTFDMHGSDGVYTGTLADGPATITFRYQEDSSGGRLTATADPGGQISDDPVQVGRFCENGRYAGG